jgi:hypothetical protein
MTELSPYFAGKLAARRPLSIDPRRSIAVKRNTHEFEIGAPARDFAAAFAAVLAEPGARFGKITIGRLPGRDGKPFTIGERFTGRVMLLGGLVADLALSDYAEIVEIRLDTPPYRAVYRYLDGCPMAGSSTFTIDDLDDRRCRFRVVFEYQELSALGVTLLNRFGIRLHDDVTRAQVETAARRLGASILSSTI